MTKRVARKPSTALHYTVLGLLLIPCGFVFALGLFLCLTIVGIVPGAALMVASAVPLAAENMRYIQKRRRWEMLEEGPTKFRTGRGKSNQVLMKMDANIEYEYDPDLDEMVPVKKPWVTEN